MIHVRRGWCFIKRDFWLWTGYRTAFLLSLVGSVVSLVQFGWTARFVAEGRAFPEIAVYGGDLVAYFLVGSAFTAFVTVALRTFQENVRSEQHMGTLESLALANLPAPLLVTYLVLWPFVYTLLNVAVLFLVVVLMFHVPLRVHFPTAAIVLVLTTLGIVGIGWASAGVTLITKRGDPIHWVFGMLTGLFAGVFYPVESLPTLLQPISALLPTTYALRALRLSLLQGASLWELRADIKILLLTCTVTLPGGLMVLHLGWKWARRLGTLAEY